MEKIDVLKIVRANDEKFKLHLEKLRRLEEKEKRLNDNNNYSKDDKGIKKEDKNSNYVYNQLFNSIENDNQEQENNPQLSDVMVNMEEDNMTYKRISNNANNNKGIIKEKIDSKLIEKEGNDFNHLRQNNQYNNNTTENKIKIDQNSDEFNNKQYLEKKKENSLISKAEKQGINQKTAKKAITLNYNNNDALSKVREHYADSDTSKSNCDDDDDNNIAQENKNNNNEENVNISNNNQLTESREDQVDNNKIMPIKPTHSKKLKIKSPIKSKLPESINAAVNENESKRPYTAYTYSTIQKIKNNSKPVKKPGAFQKVMSKQYKGKTDKVALYQMHQNDWAKKSYLRK